MNMLFGTALRILMLIMLIIVNVVIFTHTGKISIKVIMPCLTVMILYCMFFQGAMHVPGINLSSLETAADKIESGEIKEGFYQNEKGNCLISVYESDGFNTKSQGKSVFPKSMFEKTGVFSNGKEYYFSPLESFRQAEGLYMHNWYDGTILLKLDETRVININYSVDRKVDDALGFVCAPPVIKEIDFLSWAQTGNYIND